MFECKSSVRKKRREEGKDTRESAGRGGEGGGMREARLGREGTVELAQLLMSAQKLSTSLIRVGFAQSDTSSPKYGCHQQS